MIKMNINQFNTGLRRIIYQNLNVALRKSAIESHREIHNLISTLLSSSSTYASLLSGILKAEFGLVQPESPLREILSVLQNSLTVEVEPVKIAGNSLSGGLNVTMIHSDFADILALVGASYPSETFQVEWLKWLLTFGDRIIVMGAHIAYNPQAKSRSGVAIMERGGSWRVPPRFAGTIDDNWITRTFETRQVRKTVFDILQRNFQNALQ